MGTAAGNRGHGILDAGQASPMVSRLLTGLALRRLREDRGLSHEQAGQAIGVPGPEISHLEEGRAGFRMRDVVGLCALYGVSDQTDRVTLLGLARRANIPEWWHPYRDVIPPWFERYLGLEQAASVIRSFEVQFIPGLLQTPEYAQAVLALGFPSAPRHDIGRRAELRMRRQDILHRKQPARLWAVIDEAALRRPVGGGRVLRAQLRHLIAVSDMPHVTIQVAPFRLGGHPAGGGPFTVLRLPGEQLPDVAYLEQLTSARYYDHRAEPDYFRHIMDRLAIQAGPAGHSGAILSQILSGT
jgi:transcriptional regulator with XRE-family HTH domain